MTPGRTPRHAVGGRPDRLRVDADLQVEVDGVPVRITGDGSVLRVQTDRPLAVARRGRDLLNSLPAPAGTGRVGGLLHDTGLSVELCTRRGVVLRLGGGLRRPSVRPGPVALLPLAAGLGVLGSIAAAVVVGLRRGRR